MQLNQSAYSSRQQLIDEPFAVSLAVRTDPPLFQLLIKAGNTFLSWPSSRPAGGTLDDAGNVPGPAGKGAERAFIPRSRRWGQQQLPLSAGPLPEQEWLNRHEHEYRGSWVALDGFRLVAHGPDSRQVFEQAKVAGVKSPFLVLIEKDPLPSAGW